MLSRMNIMRKLVRILIVFNVCSTSSACSQINSLTQLWQQITIYFYITENGDWNWIIPNKFIAFSGPHDKARAMQGGLYTLSAVDYARLFKRLGISE